MSNTLCMYSVKIFVDDNINILSKILSVSEDKLEKEKYTFNRFMLKGKIVTLFYFKDVQILTTSDLIGTYDRKLLKFIVNNKYRDPYIDTKTIIEKDLENVKIGIMDVKSVIKEGEYLDNLIRIYRDPYLKFGESQILTFMILYKLLKNSLLSNKIAVYYDIKEDYVDFYKITKKHYNKEEYDKKLNQVKTLLPFKDL